MAKVDKGVEQLRHLVADSTDIPADQKQAFNAVIDAYQRSFTAYVAASAKADQVTKAMDHFGLRIIREALEATGGNRTQAARLLGLSRPTLIAKIEKYGLRVAARVQSGGS